MHWERRYYRTAAWLAAAGLALACGCGCRKDAPPATEHSADDGHGHSHSHAPAAVPAGHTADDGHDHGPAAAAAAPGPATSAIKPTLDAGWCAGHGVPESVCTRCNAALTPQFKTADDWCAEHELPESQCNQCNPGVAERWAALLAKPTAVPTLANTSGLTVEWAAGSLRAPGDPLCTVEAQVIRFNAPDIAAKAGIEVSTTRAQRMSAVVDCPAELRYDNARFARITPRAEGIVVEVFADLGAEVEAGATLATIDSPAMGEAKAGFIAAVQHHAIASADLERHNTIHDGLERMLKECCATEIASDELRRKYAEVRLGEYKSRLLNAHSQLELARERFERKRGLAERGIASQDESQLARRDHDQAQADFAAAHEAIEIQMETEHVALDRALRVADVTRDAARRRLLVLGVDDAEIQALAGGDSSSLSRYTLRSPIAGRVVARLAVVGESVDADDAIFSVADTARMWLLLNLQERDLIAVKPAARVLFNIDGLPGHSFEGAIDWISSEVEEPTRTVRARVPLNNPDGLLRANMFGHARVIVHDEDEVLAVPQEAVQSDGCCTIVFVQESDTVYRPRKVTLGTTAHGQIEVRSGLAAGEPVVTTGSFLLKTEVLKSSIGAGCCEVDPGR